MLDFVTFFFTQVFFQNVAKKTLLSILRYVLVGNVKARTFEGREGGDLLYSRTFEY